MLDVCMLVIQNRRFELREAAKLWSVILKGPQTSEVTQFMKLGAVAKNEESCCEIN